MVTIHLTEEQARVLSSLLQDAVNAYGGLDRDEEAVCMAVDDQIGEQLS